MSFGGRAPQGGHPASPQTVVALLVGLQDGDRADPVGAEVAVQVGQVADPADVGGLVEDDDQRRVQPPAALLGAAHPGADDQVAMAAISGAAYDRLSDSRYKVSVLSGNSTGLKQGRPGWGVTHFMTSPSRSALAAVLAVS